jgi:prevent-host-death family protein
MPTVVISTGDAMREFQLNDAKASLSSIIDAASRGEPSIIARHGKPEAVVLGFKEWERLGRLAKVPSFGRLLTSTPVSPPRRRSWRRA